MASPGTMRGGFEIGFYSFDQAAMSSWADESEDPPASPRGGEGSGVGAYGGGPPKERPRLQVRSCTFCASSDSDTTVSFLHDVRGPSLTSRPFVFMPADVIALLCPCSLSLARPREFPPRSRRPRPVRSPIRSVRPSPESRSWLIRVWIPSSSTVASKRRLRPSTLPR